MMAAASTSIGASRLLQASRRVAAHAAIMDRLHRLPIDYDSNV
jgi:hypothetical protein